MFKTRVCSKCGRELPLTSEYFYVDKRNIEGFRCECKDCQSRQYKVYYNNKHKDEHKRVQISKDNLKQRNVKICTKCKQELSATTEYFYIRKDTPDGLSYYCKDCCKTGQKRYGAKNRDAINEKAKLYNARSDIKQRKSKYDKIFYQAHKEEKAAYERERYVKADKNKIREYHRKYNKEREDYIKERNKAYREQNRDKLAEYDKQRYKKNKLSRLVSNAIGRGLKGAKNERHWEDLVPYSLSQLKRYIERQFTPEMNWDNYGEYWELDHIIPQNLFNLLSSPDSQDFQICWSLRNLRPLTVSENRSRPKDGSDILDKQRRYILDQ